MTAVAARRPSPRSLSLTGKPLRRLVRVCCARQALRVTLGVVLAALGFGYAARLAGALRAAGLGSEQGRAVLSTEGAR